MQFLVSDGQTFFHEERRDMTSETEYLDEHGLGSPHHYSRDRNGRYRLIKEIIADPHLPCLLIDARLDGDDPAFLAKLHLYVLLAPHLRVGGWGNNGNAALIVGHEFLTANKNGTWLALGASVPFVARSCGFVGATDGWQDLNSNFKMDYHFAARREWQHRADRRARSEQDSLVYFGTRASGARCIARRPRCSSRSARRFIESRTQIHRTVASRVEAYLSARNICRRRRRALSAQPRTALRA